MASSLRRALALRGSSVPGVAASERFFTPREKTDIIPKRRIISWRKDKNRSKRLQVNVPILPPVDTSAEIEHYDPKTPDFGEESPVHPSLSPVSAFIDLENMDVLKGRAWELNELRRRTTKDLRMLWFVLLKERNLLLSTMTAARQMGRISGRAERLENLSKVRRSMARLKTVVRERELLFDVFVDAKTKDEYADALFELEVEDVEAKISKTISALALDDAFKKFHDKFRLKKFKDFADFLENALEEAGSTLTIGDPNVLLETLRGGDSQSNRKVFKTQGSVRLDDDGSFDVPNSRFHALKLFKKSRVFKDRVDSLKEAKRLKKLDEKRALREELESKKDDLVEYLKFKDEHNLKTRIEIHNLSDEDVARYLTLPNELKARVDDLMDTHDLKLNENDLERIAIDLKIAEPLKLSDGSAPTLEQLKLPARFDGEESDSNDDDDEESRLAVLAEEEVVEDAEREMYESNDEDERPPQ